MTARGHVRLVAAAGMALAALGAAPASAQIGPQTAGARPRPGLRQQLVVFDRTSGRGAPSRIWAADGEGLGAHPLTAPPPGASDSHPSVGRVGRVLVFERTRSGVSQLYLADSAGRGLHGPSPFAGGRLTAFPGGAYDPSVSPVYPHKVAFTVPDHGSCDVWAMNAGSQFPSPYQPDLRRVTDHGGVPGACDSQPVWSPGGTEIAFLRTVPGPGGAATTTALVVSAAGARPAPLGLGPDPVSAFAWRPGPRIALRSDGALRSVLPGGRGRRTLARAAGLAGLPAWSADGRWISATRVRAGGASDVMVAPAAGGRLAALPQPARASDADPAWQFPDFGPEYHLPQGVEPGPGVRGRSVRPRRRRFRRHRKLGVPEASGAWTGRTSERPRRLGAQRLTGDEISFDVTGGRVRGLTIPWAIACASTAGGGRTPPLLDTTLILDAIRLRRGRLDVATEYTLDAGPQQQATVDLRLTGRVGRVRASGTLRVSATVVYEGVYTSDRCASRPPIRWTAVERRPSRRAGAT